VVGLHNNAEIGFLLSSSDQLVSAVLDLQGAGATAGGGEAGGVAGGLELIDALMSRLSSEFDMIVMDQRATDRNPYVCVVLQECARMNLLLGEIGRSLLELRMGLQGSLNMSDSMELLLTALSLDRVPGGWEAKAYPSLKPLAAWFEDILLRVSQLATWSESLLTPVTVWISGLFNPMAYITAVLQTTARQRNIPLDQMEIWTDVSAITEPSDVKVPPEDGMYIHGMCMEGAQWDLKKLCIVESAPKVLHPAMPVLVVRGVLYGSVDKGEIFECPLYVTSKRGATFIFIATLRTVDPANRWVLAGVALLMSDD